MPEKPQFPHHAQLSESSPTSLRSPDNSVDFPRTPIPLTLPGTINNDNYTPLSTNSNTSRSNHSTPLSTPLNIENNLKESETNIDSPNFSNPGKLSVESIQKSQLRHLTSISGLELLRSPSSTLQRLATFKEERSREVVTKPRFLSEGVRIPLFGDVLWSDLKRDGLAWIKNPLNFCLFLWILVVAISGALLFLVMTGMLNAVIKTKKGRDTWFEVNNQILNGLFFFLCIVVQPARIRYAIRLYRWRPQDILVMRSTFNKGGTRKPEEWKHMTIVVTSLNMNCLFQYCLSGLNWGFQRSERPAIGVAVCLTGAIGCAAFAGVYNFLSPIGKDFDGDFDETRDMAMMESGKSRRLLIDGRRAVFLSKTPVENASWSGGLVSGFCNDFRVGLLSTMCCICIFGINHERLGLGNKFVHMITFSVFLFAPFLIFVLAAVNINDDKTRHIIGGIGIGLSALGVLYGGFFRMKMRQVYNLPKRKWFCGHSSTIDFFSWIFCSCCALAQEVRTAEFYDIFDGKFYEKEGEKGREEGREGEGEEEGEGGEGGEGRMNEKWRPNMETVLSMPREGGGREEEEDEGEGEGEEKSYNTGKGGGGEGRANVLDFPPGTMRMEGLNEKTEVVNLSKEVAPSRDSVWEEIMKGGRS